MTRTTRDKVLEASLFLMLQKGYQAASVDEICERAQVSKGSFYHLYRSKEEMAVDMLEWHTDDAIEQVEQGLDLDGATGAARTLRYVQHVEEQSVELWSDGCLIGSLALELAETHPEVREKVSQIFDELAKQLEKAFVPLWKAHRGTSCPSPRLLAEQFLTVIEGGVVLSRAHRNPEFLPQALRVFRQYLELLANGAD